MCHLGHRAVPRNERSLSTVNDHRASRRRGRRWCSVSGHGLDEAIGRGVDLYVIVGAGLDTFALRRPELLKRFRVLRARSTRYAGGETPPLRGTWAGVPPGFTSCPSTSRRRASAPPSRAVHSIRRPRRSSAGSASPVIWNATPCSRPCVPGSSPHLRDPTSLRTGTDFTAGPSRHALGWALRGGLRHRRGGLERPPDFTQGAGYT